MSIREERNVSLDNIDESLMTEDADESNIRENVGKEEKVEEINEEMR